MTRGWRTGNDPREPFPIHSIRASPELSKTRSGRLGQGLADGPIGEPELGQQSSGVR